jgi:outer membrane protein assembly factor BamB
MSKPQIVSTALFMTLVLTAQTLVAQGWPMYQAGPEHTGYVPATFDSSAFTLRWQRTVGSGTLNPVTAADGKVFVSLNSTGDSLFALNAGNGQTLWTKSFGSPFSVNPPTFAYGNVYLQTCNHSSDTYLRAYDANTGGFVFRTPHAAQWERYYAPTVRDGKVYVDGGYYGGMYSFDAYSGVQEWYHSLPQYDQWTPAVDQQYAYAYVGEYTPGLYVLNRATGTQAYMIPDPNFDWSGWSMNLAPVLGSMDDCLAIHDGRLISFDLGEEAIRWELNENFSGQPTLANGVIYAINGGALTARDELTGANLWGWEVPSGSLTGTLIVTDNLLFARTSSRVYAVDLVTHQDVWSFQGTGQLALGEGTLYIAGSGGYLAAITLPEPTALLAMLAALPLLRRR